MGCQKEAHVGNTAHQGAVEMGRELPPAEGDNVQLSVRWPREIAEKVEAISRATGRTKSALFIHFVKWGLEEFEKENPDALKKHRK